MTNENKCEYTLCGRFLTEIGHEIINIMTPLEHFEYLEEEMIAARVRRGERLGKQLGKIARYISHDTTGEPYEFSEFIYDLKDKCRDLGISASIENKNYHSIETIKSRNIILNVLDEMLMNWKMHGKSEFSINIADERTIVFTNDYNPSSLKNISRTKEELSKPFVKGPLSQGSGLGLYVIELASREGGFSWNLSVDEKYFSLSLSF
jgi:Pyruvate-formate lyase-activating enzyme